MNEKLLIIVATRNRKGVVRHCMENLVAMKAPADVLAIFNDASTEYDGGWCRAFGDLVFNLKDPVGIHVQRRLHFQFAKDMIRKDPKITRVYLTDADCIHDPAFRENLIRIQDKYDQPLVCGYNTTAHSCLEGNTWGDDPSEEVIWRKYAPGVSYLLTPDHIEVVCGHLKLIEQSWDWVLGDLLGNRCAITRVGWVDHIGWKGDRHPTDEGPNGGDRVIAPTEFLVRKRAEIVAALQKEILLDESVPR